MRVQLRVQGDERGAESLLNWLRADERTRGTTLDIGTGRPGRGTMGGAEVVLAVLQTLFGFASLLVSAAAWRDARPAGRVRIVIETEQGDAIGILETASTEEMQQLFDMLIDAEAEHETQVQADRADAT